MFYESIRTHVEDAFGAHCIERENHVPQDDDTHLMQMPNMKRLISSCLDNLTTKGLYLLAMIVTGGSAKSEITRCKLKKIIKGSLSSVVGSKSHNHHKLEIHKQIFLLLINPQHFRDMGETLPVLRSQSYHAAIANILRGLQNLPSQTLIAMRRKLKGVKAPIPHLQPHKHGWARDHLIKLVKKISREMLSHLDRENEPQEPLAKAMAIADLSLKLTTGCHNIFSKEFYQFSPEVKSLQSDIMNAIWSIKKVVTVQELRKLQLLIEPKAVISNRCLRTAFVSFLTEFLFECGDMDHIPKSLSQILDAINKSSNSIMDDVLFKKKTIEEEADCILNMSASTKQIVLDLLPDDQFDQDFTDAYMEQLEESDDSGSDEDEDGSQSPEDIQFRKYEAESIGDFVPFKFHPSTIAEENVSSFQHTTSDRLNSDSEQLQPNNCGTVNLESEVHNTPRSMITDQCQGESTEQFCTFMAGQNNTKYSACKNQYITTQDACDKTSMLAYNVIGHVLEEFAKIEGLDLNLSKSLYLSGDNRVKDVEDTKEQSSSGKHARAFVQVIEELIPSFPDSSMERLKMLMGL
ncbi:uncharacterized protein LOC113864479 isoform X2 [Abrus precatorius]|nr:uncharacterized protein LOC113864479 isoform X2 [Abrus precatorius]